MEVNSQHEGPAALRAPKNPGTHGMEGWLGPKAGLDIL
jgi:hypothetical protein